MINIKIEKLPDSSYWYILDNIFGYKSQYDLIIIETYRANILLKDGAFRGDLNVALYNVIHNMLKYLDIDIFENITNSELLNILNTDVKIDIK